MSKCGSKEIVGFFSLLFCLLVFSAAAQPVPGDVDGSGTVDAVDIQLVINAALGIDISGELKGRWFQATDTAPFGGRRGHTSVVHDGKMWVIGGYNSDSGILSDVWCSEDGVSWTVAAWEAPFGGRRSHTSVVYDGKIWVIGGRGSKSLNDVWYSENGEDWQAATLEAPWPERWGHTSVVFDGKIWVIGGYNLRDV